jgi:DNA-binding response OmpR family regulator
MKKILLIEDDTDLFTLLKYNLEKEGFIFAGAETGKGALELCWRQRPDLVLLDIMLPDTDGLEICRRIREDPQFGHIPIIFLTARASETDRIVGLELGANDYIVKPFFLRELIARIKIQFRSHVFTPAPLKADALTFDRSRCRAQLSEQSLPLTATEFRMLEFLMLHPGVVFTRQQIIHAIWDKDHQVTDHTVDVCILRLRLKIESDPTHPKFIRSVRGFGYSFDDTYVDTY